MEYSRSDLDLLLWPRNWHKRLSNVALTLIPGVVIVGFFDMLASPDSILTDFLLTGDPGVPFKLLLFTVCAVFIGLLDVFCFAWPIADFCRYLAKRGEKFISPGFNIVLMKSYAYSHIVFLPILLLTTPTGLQFENIGSGTPFLSRMIVFIIIILIYTQIYWQLGIMLRTVSVKSKLEYSKKLIIAAVMLLWANLSGTAIHFLIRGAYRLFEALEKTS